MTNAHATKGQLNPLEGLPVAEHSLPLPVFFASVSSVKYDRPVAETLDLLVQAEYPALLISAYDYAHSGRTEQGKIRRLVKRARERGLILLVDSGRYESFWLRDDSWDRAAFLAAIRKLKPPLTFSFDAPANSENPTEVARDAVERAVADQADLPETTVVPIVHGTPAVLPDAVAEVASLLAPIAVAVPERELGEGLVRRAESLHRIVRALEEREAVVPLHLLGTGDPISMLVYAAFGAASFDGLEWCHTVVNFDDATLHHLQHFDLFAAQSGMKVSDGLFQQAAQAHNLIFMIDWMRRIRDARPDNLAKMIAKYVPKPGRKMVEDAIAKSGL